MGSSERREGEGCWGKSSSGWKCVCGSWAGGYWSAARSYDLLPERQSNRLPKYYRDELHKAECAGLPFWKGTRLPRVKLAIGAGLACVSQRRTECNGGKKDTGRDDVQKETYFFFRGKRMEISKSSSSFTSWCQQTAELLRTCCTVSCSGVRSGGRWALCQRACEMGSGSRSSLDSP